MQGANDEAKPESAAKRRQREAHEAAVERAVAAAPQVSADEVRHLLRAHRAAVTRRGEKKRMADEQARADRSEAEAAEAWLNQLDPATVEWRDAVHFRAIIAARKNVTAAEAALEAAVRAARAAGDSWALIGAALDIGTRAAQERYGE